MTHASRRLFSAIFALLAATYAVTASTEIAAWDFDSFDPGVDTSISSGSSVFDWANIGTANTSSVPGVSGTGIQFANVSDPGKHFDISLDLTGLDIPILYLSGARSSSFLGGSWSYSVDGGTSFIPTDFTQNLSTSAAYRQNTFIFENTALRNQDDVVLRYTFSGSAPAGAATAKFDNFSVSAVNATQVATFVAGGVTNQRALVGVPTALAPQVNFAISERTGAPAQYTVDGSNITIPPPFVSGTTAIPANLRSSLPVKLDATGAVAGDVVTARLNVHNIANAETSSASMDFQMVENRAITTGTSGNFGNIGRVVAGKSFGQIEYSGGEAADTHATRITQNAGDFVAGANTSSANYINKGSGNYVVVRSAGTVFNGAGQTSVSDLLFPSWAGYGTKTLSIENFNPRAFYDSGSWYMYMTSSSLLRGEGFAGEVLDLEGVSLNVQATVVQDRQITGGVVSVGRQMVDVDGPNNLVVAGSTTANLSGGALSDDVATRVNLAASTSGSLEVDGVSVVTGGASFNAANVTSAATMNYSFEVDTTQTGSVTKSVNMASALTDGEAESTGATLQSSLQVGAKYTVVDNRQLFYSNVVVAAVAGHTYDNLSLGSYISTVGDDDHYTRLTVDGLLFNDANDQIYDVAYHGDLSGSASSSYQKVATSSVNVVGEGLAGETVAQVSYDVYVKFVEAASATVSPSSVGALGDGSFIDIAAAAGGVAPRADVAVHGTVIGNSGFSVNGNSSGYLYDYVYAGTENTLNIGFDSNGRMNGTHTAKLSLALYNDYYDGTASYMLSAPSIGQYTFNLSHTVTGASGQSGNATVASGGSLKDSGIGLNYTGSFTNETGFLDSDTLEEDIDIQIAYIDASTAPEARLASDIVHVEGLDGIKFVMQLKYSEVAMISLFGAEEYAQINWCNEDYGLWMNAIYGNSDQGLTGQKFLMSYDSYLGQEGIGGTPRLSDFGVDITNNVVWAVLDHNSEFGSSGPTAAAVPEPSTYALLGLGAVLVFLARRRIRRAA